MIEYWDIERKRYPQYDHVAVIVAEDITSRLLNVVSLFNGFIPLVAIQLQAFQIGDQVSLVCTTVLSQVTLGLVEEDVADEAADRTYWEGRSGKVSLETADGLHELAHTVAPALSFKYNRGNIRLARDGQDDPITDEIRSVRRRRSVRFDNDVSRLFADVRQRETTP